MERGKSRRSRISGKAAVIKVVSPFPAELVDIAGGEPVLTARTEYAPSDQKIVVSNGKSVMILEGDILRAQAVSASEVLDGNPPGYEVAIRFLDVEGPMSIGLTA